MIPSYEKFISRHMLFFSIGCCLAMIVLTSSLARNSVALNSVELFFGIAAIGGSFAWGIARDDRAYWMYTICSLRMFEHQEDLESLSTQQISKVDDYLAMPWCSLLVTLVVAALLSLVGEVLLKPGLDGWLLICGMIFLPYWIYYIHARALRSSVRKVILHVSQRSLLKIKKQSVTGHLTEEALIMLMVNLSLVLPIAHKAAFNLDRGSQSPAFIIAMIILMEIVTAFMLMLSFKSKKYIFCGELMLGALNPMPASSFRFAKYKKPTRVIFWLLTVPLWTTGICLILAGADRLNFALLYLACLLFPLFIYLVEHRYSLRLDRYYATKILNELKRLAPNTNPLLPDA